MYKSKLKKVLAGMLTMVMLVSATQTVGFAAEVGQAGAEQTEAVQVEASQLETVLEEILQDEIVQSAVEQPGTEMRESVPVETQSQPEEQSEITLNNNEPEEQPDQGVAGVDQAGAWMEQNQDGSVQEDNRKSEEQSEAGEGEEGETEAVQSEAATEVSQIRGMKSCSGTWICKSVSTDGGKFKDKLDGKKALELCQLGIFEDGTVILLKSGKEIPGAWEETEKGIALLLQPYGEESFQVAVPLTEKGGALLLQLPGENNIFRLEKEEKDLALYPDTIAITTGENGTHKSILGMIGFAGNQYEVTLWATDFAPDIPGEYLIIYTVTDQNLAVGAINKEFFVYCKVVVTQAEDAAPVIEPIVVPGTSETEDTITEPTEKTEQETYVELGTDLETVDTSEDEKVVQMEAETEAERLIEPETITETESVTEQATEYQTEEEILIAEETAGEATLFRAAASLTEEDADQEIKETDSENEKKSETVIEGETKKEPESENEAVEMGSIRILATDVDTGKSAGTGFCYLITVAEDIVDSTGAVRMGTDREGKEVLLTKGTVVASLATDEDGTATSGELYAGTYQVTEEETAEYYAKVVYIDPVVVTDGIEQISLPHLKSRIEVSKVDANDSFKPLKGVTFRVFTDAEMKPEKVKEYNQRIANFKVSQDVALEEFLKEQEQGYAEFVSIQEENLAAYKEEGHSRRELEDFLATQEAAKEQYESDAAQKKEEFTTGQENALAAFIVDLADTMNVHLEETGREYETDADGYVRMENLKHGTAYYVLETKVPEGYNADSNIYEIFVDEDGLIEGQAEYSLALSNTANSVKFHVLDKAGEELLGATMMITNLKGEEVHTWNSSAQPYGIWGLKAGTYYLQMIKAPEGYALPGKITFKVKDQLALQEVSMTCEKIRVGFTLTDAATHEALKGAKLVVRNRLGKEADNWITDGEEYLIELPAGEYVLSQESAPDGYATASPVAFTVTNASSYQSVGMEEEPLVLRVSMQAEGQNTELAGAAFSLLDKDGEEVDAWTTESAPHLIRYLPVGNYTLRETRAPEGYCLMGDVSVSVTDTQEVQSVALTNEQIKLSVSLKDTNGEILSGGELLFIDPDGKEVDVWSTGQEAHLLSGIPAGIYILRQSKVPIGYVTAGDVTVTVTNEPGVQSAEMQNVPTVVKISLKGEETQELLSGAELSILNADGTVADTWTTDGGEHVVERLAVGEHILRQTKCAPGYTLAQDISFTVSDREEPMTVAMFNTVTKTEIVLKNEEEELIAGSQLIIKDAEGKEIDRFTTAEEVYVKEKLAQGDYILTQVIPASGYVSAESVPFTVTEENITLHVSMVNQLSHVEVEKKDLTNSRFLKGAALKVLDSKGNTVEEWISQESAYVIKGLPIGDYILEESAAPAGYERTERMNFTVEDTRETQVFTMYNKPREGTTSLVGTKQLTSTTSLNGTLTEGAGNGWGGNGTGTGAVQTGDDTPIYLYMLLLAGAAAVLGISICRRVRRKKW